MDNLLSFYKDKEFSFKFQVVAESGASSPMPFAFLFMLHSI